MGNESEMLKLSSDNEKDRISALPDRLIHHILGLLPSPKHAIRTGYLSKRWQHLWTYVPNLSFRYDDGSMHMKPFSKFVDGVFARSSCSEINKLSIKVYGGSPKFFRSRLSEWLRLAFEKQVKEVTLIIDIRDEFRYLLPRFFYEFESVIEMKLEYCAFVYDLKKINWRSLKVLYLGYVELSDRTIGKFLRGSPLLESLELFWCDGFNGIYSCSKRLKRLVLGDIDKFETSEKLEISCPSLEKLELTGNFGIKELILMEMPDLICATLDFEPLCVEGKNDFDSEDNFDIVDVDSEDDFDFDVMAREFIEHPLHQVKHAQELKLGSWFIEVLSAMELKGLPCPLIKSTCLILNFTHFDTRLLPGIAMLLRSLPGLEKLVVDLCSVRMRWHPTDYKNEAEHWTTYKTKSIFLPHLKTVEIIGLNYRIEEYDLFLEFVKFILKNANVLQKMAILDAPKPEDSDEDIIFQTPNDSDENRADFVAQVSEKLLSMPRSSLHENVIFVK